MKIRSAAYLMLITILSMTPACNALDPEPDPTPSYERDVLPQAVIGSVTSCPNREIRLSFALAEGNPASITRLSACLSHINTQPDTTDSVTDLLALYKEGIRNVQISNIYPNTTYYVRLFISNRTASAYSETVNFRLDAQSSGEIWTEIAKTPLTSYYTFSHKFVLQGKVYFLSNYIGQLDAGGRALWEFDPANLTWKRKSDFPGAVRCSAAAFSLKGKGYFGGGYEYDKDTDGFVHQLYDWWMYDPEKDQWSRKNDIPGEITNSTFSFQSDNCGYVPRFTARQDILCYHPGKDSWNTLDGYPGRKALHHGCTAEFEKEAYIIGGEDWGEKNTELSRCWKYVFSENRWAPIADFAGGPRTSMTAIAFNGKIYAGGGRNAGKDICDWWSYDPESGKWETEICYPGYLAPALSFVVNGKAYLLIYQTIYLFSPGNKREDG